MMQILNFPYVLDIFLNFFDVNMSGGMLHKNINSLFNDKETFS